MAHLYSPDILVLYNGNIMVPYDFIILALCSAIICFVDSIVFFFFVLYSFVMLALYGSVICVQYAEYFVHGSVIKHGWWYYLGSVLYCYLSFAHCIALFGHYMGCPHVVELMLPLINKKTYFYLSFVHDGLNSKCSTIFTVIKMQLLLYYLFFLLNLTCPH